MPMIVKTIQILVHCEHDTLWQLLMDRVDHPERYTPGVAEVRTLEKSDEVRVRELKLHGELVKERIEINPYDSFLRYELLEHPQFSGTIVTRVVRTARQSPVAPIYLEYDLDLQTRSFHVEKALKGEEEIMADIDAEMQKLKSGAEEMESRA